MLKILSVHSKWCLQLHFSAKFWLRIASAKTFKTIMKLLVIVILLSQICQIFTRFPNIREFLYINMTAFYLRTICMLFYIILINCVTSHRKHALKSSIMVRFARFKRQNPLIEGLPTTWATQFLPRTKENGFFLAYLR